MLTQMPVFGTGVKIVELLIVFAGFDALLVDADVDQEHKDKHEGASKDVASCSVVEVASTVVSSPASESSLPTVTILLTPTTMHVPATMILVSCSHVDKLVWLSTD